MGYRICTETDRLGNGDLDYSGSINADDYFLIDQAFSNQSSLPAPLLWAHGTCPDPPCLRRSPTLGSFILRAAGSPRGESFIRRPKMLLWE